MLAATTSARRPSAAMVFGAISEGAVAREPSARTTFGIGSDSVAPAVRSWSPSGCEVDSVDERLDLELAEAGHDPTALDDGHLVIGDLRDRCLVGDEVDATPAGAERRDGGQGLAAAYSAVSSDRISAGGSRREASKFSSSRSSSEPRAPTGSFSVQRGVSASPVR